MTVRYLRKVIKIAATDSPNVRARRNVLPGVISWAEFKSRMLTWDTQRKTVGLFGEFYEGAEVMMYPAANLVRAESLALEWSPPPRGSIEWRTTERWIGCDPAEGGDRSAWCVGDRRRMLDLVSIKTPDTTLVVDKTLELMSRWNVPAGNVCFDLGGGGKEHVDRLRRNGHVVRGVSFGESVAPPVKRQDGRRVPHMDKVDEREERTIYKNRRAAMYGTFMVMLDPAEEGWAIPGRLLNVADVGRKSLKEQLLLIPKLYDAESKLYVLPKNKPKADRKEDGTVAGNDTLSGLIGHSPDEADAVVVMVHCMTVPESKPTIVGVS